MPTTNSRSHPTYPPPRPQTHSVLLWTTTMAWDPGWLNQVLHMRSDSTASFLQAKEDTLQDSPREAACRRQFPSPVVAKGSSLWQVGSTLTHQFKRPAKTQEQKKDFHPRRPSHVPLSSTFLFSRFIFWTSAWQREIQIFTPWNNYNNQGLAGLKTCDSNTTWLTQVTGRGQALEPSFAALPVALPGSWIGSGAAGPEATF